MRELLPCLLIAILVAGCGCSETGLGGDARLDVAVDGMDSTGVDVTGSDPFGDFSGWDPRDDHMGTSGWRDSTDPFCNESDWVINSWRVWSDSRGVFTMLSEMNPGGGTCPPPSREESMGAASLAFNDGMGWARYFDTLTCGMFECWRDLAGIPGGTLFLLTEMFDPEMCGPTTTTTEGPLTLEPLEYQYIFVVDVTLAYGVLRSGLLVYFDGESWGPFPPDPTPHTPNVVWADRGSVFIGAREGVIMSHEDGDWRIHDTRTLGDIRQLWGFGANDVWAGTNSGMILHWDGAVWEEKEWPSMAEGCDAGESIEGMWGSDGVLYFHTRHDLVLWDGAAFMNILNYRCGEPYQDINGLWGNAPDEVFVSVYDQTSTREGCDDLILLWWDGHAFHWF